MNNVAANQELPITLLIIDDDLVDRKSIRRALMSSHRPIIIIEAKTGAEGIAQFENNIVDVLLIDYRLPDIDGLALIKVLLARKKTDATIIMVSQHEDEILSLNALNVGAHDFLLKTEVNSERLMRTIRQAQHRQFLEGVVREKNNALEWLANRDSLTQLINRYTFEKTLKDACTRVLFTGDNIALLFIDLDNFKKVNDTLGHFTGDKLLQNVATRLASVIKDGDCLARLGGDEFVILANNIDSEQQTFAIATQVIDALTPPLQVGNTAFSITASIGISMLGEFASSPEAMMKCADIAMYKAKQNGRNHFCLYTDILHQETQSNAILEEEMSYALQLEQFVVYYQPQICTKTKKVKGVEALIRWDHPTRGVLAPGVFLDMAEELNLISEIGQWVLQTACNQLKQWQLQYNLLDEELTISVNLSALQLQDVRLLSLVSHALESSQLSPCCLELEITESSIIHSPENIVERLHELTRKNVKLALDDFGTGYSSIKHLHLFPIHSLKVDKSFIAAYKQKKSQDKVLEAMINFAKYLGLCVIAEGVETAEQLDFCQSQGCDLIQGYYYSKPICAADFEAKYLAI
ncbi:EAL domain-containing protein [Shewanella sp. SR43-4]|jgi:diguanylate cyclase (GGDEF)-like protein|uniref:putative bifunctional diguanylate cyclase/phosphodiesterase n=1 Tax=Shewanella TaxID=22 RepID=UPI0015F7D39D|nr:MULTISPECIES: GGDEF domain-containing response regulator [unclassified Shewanella]MBB1317453.1 EAL domain-containing protein [Shewanella sp. SR43-4]MBB1475011.1 EAL domain-containing protein [Shewanella sp. SG41-3]